MKAPIDSIAMMLPERNLYNKGPQPSGLQGQTFILLPIDLHSGAELSGLQFAGQLGPRQVGSGLLHYVFILGPRLKGQWLRGCPFYVVDRWCIKGKSKSTSTFKASA